MTRPDVLIVLQARMNSRRLPGKAMEPIAGRPLLAHCITRLQSLQLGRVIVATTKGSGDDLLAAEAVRVGAEVFRGDETDVLGRFAAVTRLHEPRFVVRATGDNPALDPESAVRLLRVVEARKADHGVEDHLPYGSTLEVLTAQAVLRASDRTRDAADREHVTPSIRRPHSGFRCIVVPAPPDRCRSELRFTVDTPSDLAYMRAVIEEAERKGTVPAPLPALIAAADRIAKRVRVA